MDIQHEKLTRIAIGHAATTDPFQSGREAAEAARVRLDGGEPDLVLALGPTEGSFKDFIEGVRLAVGESSLVGIPVPWVCSTEGSDGPFVCLLQGESHHLSIVSAPEKENPLRGVTSLMTELRRRRGSSRLDFNFHGMMVFDTGLTVERRLFAHLLSSEAGLESWIAGFGVWTQSVAPLICGSRFVPSGLAAIECLTEDQWGLGWVDTSAFPPGHELRKEASRSALREALGQLGARKAAVVFLFFATTDRPTEKQVALEAIEDIRAAHPHLPVIAFPARSPYLRAQSGTVSIAAESVIALAVPE